MRDGLYENVTSRLSAGSKNRRTKQSYLAGVRQFSEWAKKNGYKYWDQMSKDIIQEYADYPTKEGRTAGTVHTRLAPVCVGAGIPMGEIAKPKRTVSTLVRGRSVKANPDGHRQADQERFSRLVGLQKALGIRRAELAVLTGADAVRGSSGLVEQVVVRRGKGGKRQEQWILPARREEVTAIFEGIAADQKVFTKAEMSNKINLHGLRARVAREAYDYYAGILQRNPETADRMRSGLMETFAACNDPAKTSSTKMYRFKEDVYNPKIYRLRGESYNKAKQNNRPVEYDRLALMMVSVYHLAHWRLDVTVTNYMIAEEEK